MVVFILKVKVGKQILLLIIFNSSYISGVLLFFLDSGVHTLYLLGFLGHSIEDIEHEG